MGLIDSRLTKVLQLVKPGAPIPIIVETFNPPSPSDISSLSSFMSVKRKSVLLNQVFGEATPNNIQNISSLLFVSIVHYDEPVIHFALPSISINKTDINIPVSESAAYIGARKLNDIGITGKGIKIAVIDTGANSDHPMLRGAIIKQINIAAQNGALQADIDDGNGHGTHTASTIAGREVTIQSKFLGKQVTLRGVAPEAKLVIIKVLDDTGSGQTSWIMEGIEAAVNENVDIISMSLGSMFDGAGVSPDSRTVDEVVFNHNILCSVAAGNSFFNFSIGSPGGAHGALTVGSTSIYTPTPGIVSTFSSKGTTTDGRFKPDICAPGGNLLDPGTGLVGKETIYSATSGAMAKEAGGEEYIGIMGTSMACPHVSGALALLLQAGMKRDRYYVEDLLANTAMQGHPKDPNSGWGTIDVAKAYDYLINNKNIIPVSTLSRIIDASLAPLAAIAPVTQQSASSLEVGLPYMR